MGEGARAVSGNIVSIDEKSLRNDVKNLVRRTVEETLNALLDERASELMCTGRYMRTAGREDYSSGHYTGKLVPGAGEVEPGVPKLREATFQTAMIERYRSREISVEETIVEMYLAGVSTRRIEDVSELQWGAPVSSGTVSNLNEKAFAAIEEWRQKPLEDGCAQILVDEIYLKRSWAGLHENVTVRLNASGDRKIIECPEGYAESADSWRKFFPRLKERGLSGIRLVTGVKCSERECSVPSMRCSRRPATTAALCTSTATCWRGSRWRREMRSLGCSRRFTRRSRAKRVPARRRRSLPSSTI